MVNKSSLEPKVGAAEDVQYSEQATSCGNIILVGMPGAGKSTVGVVLAKILGMEFIDTDLLIQRTEGQTLQRLIDDKGPESFIRIENEVLKGVHAENAVIATGGSAVYSTEGMEHLRELGKVVYLKASLEELKRRLVDFDERGIVIRPGKGNSLEDLLNDRGELYEAFAHVAIDIDGMGITESARKVAKTVS